MNVWDQNHSLLVWRKVKSTENKLHKEFTSSLMFNIQLIIKFSKHKIHNFQLSTEFILLKKPNKLVP